MSTAAALLTVEEFLLLPENPDVKRELIEGVVVEMSHAAVGHEIVKSNWDEVLILFVAENRIGKVFSETLFVLAPDTGCIPDVAFVLSENLQAQDRSKRYQGAPTIAIEVVSSETAAQLESKIRNYLRWGSRAVWVAYPPDRMVRVCRPDGTSRWLEQDQFLEEPEVLPGFRVQVARIFEGL